MTKTSSKPSPVKNISVCGISMKPQKNQKPLVRLDQSSKSVALVIFKCCTYFLLVLYIISLIRKKAMDVEVRHTWIL